MHYRLAAAVTSRARSTQPEDLRAKIRPCFSPPVWPSESFRAIAVTRIEETRDEMKRGNVGHSWFLLCSPPRRVDERDERGSSAPPCLLCKVCCRYDAISYNAPYWMYVYTKGRRVVRTGPGSTIPSRTGPLSYPWLRLAAIASLIDCQPGLCCCCRHARARGWTTMHEGAFWRLTRQASSRAWPFAAMPDWGAARAFLHLRLPLLLLAAEQTPILSRHAVRSTVLV